MASAAQHLLTSAEYLAIEAAAEQKSEFYAGERKRMTARGSPTTIARWSRCRSTS
jgi:hypothetical protein